MPRGRVPTCTCCRQDCHKCRNRLREQELRRRKAAEPAFRADPAVAARMKREEREYDRLRRDMWPLMSQGGWI